MDFWRRKKQDVTEGEAPGETLGAAGEDRFVGHSPSYPWGRVYGGQVVAQARRAATNTVARDRFVHSLHVQFVRGGDSALPIHLAVTRVRDGGSFSLRSVEARQAGAVHLIAESLWQPKLESKPVSAGSRDFH